MTRTLVARLVSVCPTTGCYWNPIGRFQLKYLVLRCRRRPLRALACEYPMVMPFAPEDIQFGGVFMKFAACHCKCEEGTDGESCGKVEQGRCSSASAHWRPRSAYRIEPSCQTGRHERSTRVHTDHLDTLHGDIGRPIRRVSCAGSQSAGRRRPSHCAYLHCN